MKRLLLLSHAPSPNTRRLTDAVAAGAECPDAGGVVLIRAAPLSSGPDALLAADAVILGTPENFGYMSGALKDFFDRSYYPCLEQTRGLAYGLFIRAGNDGRGARSSVERIVAGLGWRPACEPLIAAGELSDDHIEQAETLGLTLAAGLDAGIF